MDRIKRIHLKSIDTINLVVFVVLAIAGVAFSSLLLIVLAVYTAACLFSASPEEGFCMGLFLLPNIRLFDSLGITFLVNVLLIIPLIKYLIVYKTKLSAFAICSTGLLFVVEFVHTLALNNADNIVPSFSCFLSMFYCLSITTNKSVDLQPARMWKFLVAGILASSFAYLVANPWFSTDIVSNVIQGHRFVAYASDPNYFSLYICVALAYAFVKCQHSVMDGVVIVFLLIVGFLTASKMCALVMAVTVIGGFLYSFCHLKIESQRRFFLAGITLIVVCVCVFSDQIFLLFDNILRRAGVEGSSVNVSELTSGRTDILGEYIQALSANVVLLLFGYGMQYHLYIPTIEGYGAHNTYLDIILAWGLLGAVLFVVVLLMWRKEMSFFQSKRLVCYLPLLNLLIVWFGLSCLSATMFWWVLSFVMVVITSSDKGEKISGQEASC